MKKSARIILILIAVVCFGVALSYPISEYVQQKQSQNTMDRLAALRDAGLEAAASQATDAPATDEPEVPDEPDEDGEPVETDALVNAGEKPVTTKAPETAKQAETTKQPEQASASEEEELPAVALSAQGSYDAEAPAVQVSETNQPGQKDQPVQANQPSVTSAVAEQGSTPETEAPGSETVAADHATAQANATVAPADAKDDANVSAASDPTPSPTATPKPTASPTPSPTPNRRVNTGAQVWADVEKVALDESKILPQYRQLYAINNEMVGWMTISGTKIDYPVMQTENEEYYLSHDFFHEENINGLLILDHNCDPYTPSYNLVVSGHNRKNDTIFSKLTEYYQDKRHWDVHKFIQFDSLMEERTYVVFAAFFAADYDVDEEGFRYNANIEYGVDANQWLAEIRDYQLYETDIPTAFGDEFLTLTTCNSSRRKNGRFVVVARRLREGEVIE